MKIRMYMDVPTYWSPSDQFGLWATTKPLAGNCYGRTRIMFEVDVPDGICRSHDVAAPVAKAIEMSSDQMSSDPEN